MPIDAPTQNKHHDGWNESSVLQASIAIFCTRVHTYHLLGFLDYVNGTSATTTPQKNVIVSPTNNEELLQESIEQNHKQRMQQLANQQKTKHQKGVDEQQKHPNKTSKITVQPNPFSRFLLA